MSRQPGLADAQPESDDIELQVFPDPATLPTAAGPALGNADPDDPEENEVEAPLPLGVKLTAYRILNMLVILTFGVAKFILSLKGQSVVPTGLDWVAGSLLAAL
jgi:hypothetical protein